MPVSVSYPGVYIEEIPSGVRTITGVATSITAFVGKALRGPRQRARHDHELRRLRAHVRRARTCRCRSATRCATSSSTAARRRSSSGSTRSPRRPPARRRSTVHEPDAGGRVARRVGHAAARPRRQEGRRRTRTSWRPRSGLASAGRPVQPHVRDGTTGVDRELPQPHDEGERAARRSRARQRVAAGGVGEQRRAAHGCRARPARRRAHRRRRLDRRRQVDGRQVGRRRRGRRQRCRSDRPSYKGSAANKTGLYALEKADLFNLLCIPPTRAAATCPTTCTRRRWPTARSGGRC